MMFTYVTSLIHNYRDKRESRDKEFFRPLVELSRHFIHTVELHIMDHIKPILSEWGRKKQLLYSWTSVESTRCFFGVDEGHILSNMADVLPSCFARALSASHVDCKSLRQFTRMVATDAAAKVNSRIALEMCSTQVHLKKISKCKCIDFKTMDTLVSLAAEIIECMPLDQCKCSPQKRDKSSTAPIQAAHLLLPHAVTIRKSLCDISYFTSDEAVMTILTETDATLINGANDQDVDNSIYCDDGMDLTWSPSGDDQEDAEDPDISTLAESAAMLESHVENYKLLIMVVTELLMCTMKKAQASLCQADFKRIVQTVSEKALQQIKLKDISASKALNKTCDALFSDLSQRSHSAKMLLAELQRADDVVIKALRSHLTAQTKKRNAVARIFSSAGRSIKMRFQDIIHHGPYFKWGHNPATTSPTQDIPSHHEDTSTGHRPHGDSAADTQQT
ncbi:hypothetical protein JOB18_000792 [Solea senegalensis]|uniref:Uncharacterized protein n=1 Tax=Solea senegalensis TaxID=28829 RepID=A0AAV6SYD3_SOLSE|nr:hypothetical protein JOB18_000792 [Solea senegalensis]